jgi:hypothetical protein
MSSGAKLVGLILTAVMFAFSTWMYLRTGDWVAAVFAAGSLGYAIFFLSRLPDRQPPRR